MREQRRQCLRCLEIRCPRGFVAGLDLRLEGLDEIDGLATVLRLELDSRQLVQALHQSVVFGSVLLAHHERDHWRQRRIRQAHRARPRRRRGQGGKPVR
jgi:hypothetical protein